MSVFENTSQKESVTLKHILTLTFTGEEKNKNPSLLDII